MKTQRPASVTVIGLISILTAGLSILSAPLGLVMFLLMKPMGGPWTSMPADAPWGFRLMWRMFPYLMVLQTLVAVFALAAGIQFLRLRAWARTAFEVMYWLALIWIVGFGVYWVATWLSVTSTFPEQGGPPFPPHFFRVFGAIVGAVVTAFSAVPCGVIIWLLRGSTIRQAMVGGRGPDLPPASAAG
jgi:hypothetical protein